MPLLNKRFFSWNFLIFSSDCESYKTNHCAPPLSTVHAKCFCTENYFTNIYVLWWILQQTYVLSLILKQIYFGRFWADILWVILKQIHIGWFWSNTLVKVRIFDGRRIWSPNFTDLENMMWQILITNMMKNMMKSMMTNWMKMMKKSEQ